MAGDLMSFPSNCRVWRSICVESNVGRLMYTQFSSLSVGSWGSHSLAGSHNSKTEDMISWGQELSCPPCRLWTHQWSMQPERVPHVYDKDQGFTDTAPLTILHARIWSQDESCPRKSIYVEATLFAEMTTTWFKNIHCSGWSWGWSSNTLATWCEELTHWKWPWCWERLKAGGEGDDRGRDGRMASLTQWTWVWANSRNWWWTGKPGVLQSMGLQRVGHNWATELTDWPVNLVFRNFCDGQESALQCRVRVWSLLWEDSTCLGVNKPVCHNYWDCMPRAHALQQNKSLQWKAHALQVESGLCSPQLEEAWKQQQRSSAAKIKKKKNLVFSMYYLSPKIYLRSQTGEKKKVK